MLLPIASSERFFSFSLRCKLAKGVSLPSKARTEDGGYGKPEFFSGDRRCRDHCSHSGGCSYIVQQNDPDMICPGI